MGPYFSIRGECPVCYSREGRVIYQCGYSEAPIRDYLTWFYEPQGSADLEILADEQYVLLKCDNCQLIYQESIPNEQFAQTLYEQWIDPGIVRAQAKSKSSLAHALSLTHEVANIIKYLDRSPGELKFLDFGMGWGEWCLCSQALGVDTYGIEISQSRKAYAQEMGIKVLSQEELRQHRFDFINTEQVFEHLSKPRETLDLLVNTLSNKGVIKISVPDGANMENRLRNPQWFAPKGSLDSFNAVAPLEHLNCFCHKTLVTMATYSGLRQIRIPEQLTMTRTSDQLSLGSLLRHLRQYLRQSQPTLHQYLDTVLFFEHEKVS